LLLGHLGASYDLPGFVSKTTDELVESGIVEGHGHTNHDSDTLRLHGSIITRSPHIAGSFSQALNLVVVPHSELGLIAPILA
jgi:hypothetical protein